MPGKTVPGDPDSKATEKLRALTNTAAGLIRGKTSEDWRFAVRASGWEYAVMLVAFVVTRDGDPVPVEYPLHRVVGYRIEEPSAVDPTRRIAVLEPTAFRHKNMTVRLQSAAGHGSTGQFSRADQINCIQFWTDVNAGLGAHLRRFLPRGLQSNIGILSAEAADALSKAVAMRRARLNINLGELSDLTQVPAEELAQIEDGEIKATWSTLGKIETAFDQRGRSILDVELGGVLEPADELLGSYGVHDLGDAPSTRNGDSLELRSTGAPVVAAAYGGVLPPFAVEFAPLPEIITGNDIRKIRQGVGMSLRDLAKYAEVDLSHLSHVENGANVTPRMKERIQEGVAKWQASQGRGMR